jgi:chitinase
MPAPPVGPLKMPGLVMYWGQNGFGGANPGNAAKYEKDLGTTCIEHPEYDVVVLAFVTSFVRTRNADGYPEMNFANHCEAPWDARNPFLLKCPDIGAGIETCHQKGKRVLLSLGGASGSYGFVSDDEARTFAKTTWDMFLGGSSAIRPFAPATLDGVDLDLEGGSSTGYSAYVKALRTLMDASAARKYYIAAAPQCPFPDAYLGPAAGKALGDAPTAFDFLFVQFYNNFCAGTSPAAFTTAWNSWAGVAANGGPKIFVGLPATPQAANAASFVDRANLPSLLAGVKGASAFGGVMLWDVSFDQNSAASDGKTYGVAARAL